MVIKPDKLYVVICLLAFLALTVHPKPQWILKVLEQPAYRNVPVKIFNCNVNIKTKDCAGSQPFCITIVFMARLHNQSLN